MFWYYIVLKKVIKKDNYIADQNYYKMVIWTTLDCPIIGYHTFEYDSKNILYCNYVFKYKCKIDFTKLVFKGCHIHVQKISNKDEMFKIMKYIHKDYQLHIYAHQLI